MPLKEGEQSGKSGTLAGMRDAMKKATTEMLILFLLRQKEMYVYEMIQEMARLTDGVLTFNTLYLAIYRLQERGQIRESERRIVDGRARAYFAITTKGQEYLQSLMEEYRIMTGAINSLLVRDGQLYRGVTAMYERELNGYYKQAVRWLECGHMQRQKFRQYLVVSAEDYLSQRPEASFEEVCQALGTPQQAAQAFMEILPEGAAEQWSKRHRKIVGISLALMGFLIAVLAAAVVWYYCVQGIAIVERTIIDYGSSIPLDALPTAEPIE